MKLLYFFLFSLLLLSCKKNEGTTEPQAPIEFTINKSEATPGDIIELKANSKLSVATVDISFNSSMVKGYLKGDSSYVFMVPVAPEGAVAIKFPKLPNANNLQLTIGKYAPITNSQSVIDNYVYDRDRLIDTLLKVRPNGYQLPVATITLIKQLKDDWNLQMKKMSSEDKLMLAYILDKNRIPASLFTESAFPSDTKSARLLGPTNEETNLLITHGKVFVTRAVIAVVAGKAMIDTGVFLLNAPSVLSATLFGVSVLTFTLSVHKAQEEAEIIAKLPGVEETLLKFTASRITAVEFKNNDEKQLQMTMKARSLNLNDIGLNPEIDAMFKIQSELKNIDTKVENIYNSAVKYISSVTSPYTPYSPLIGQSPAITKDVEVDGSDITVTSVSDSKIFYTTSLVGNVRKIKVTSNSVVDVPFKIMISYKRSIDQKEFTAEIDAIYKAPEPFSLSLVSGNNQKADANKALSNPLVVSVKDNKGLPLSGVSVAWNVTSGGGKVTNTTTLTNANGQASNTWTIGASGTQTVTATVKKADGSNITNSPITFNAVINNNDIYKLEYVSGNGQTYGGGGMPLPMVFKIKNVTADTYESNLSALGLSLSASADIGYQDLAFNNLNNFCGANSLYCFGGYYYIPSSMGQPFTPFTLNILVTLKQNGKTIDTYNIQQNIRP